MSRVARTRWSGAAIVPTSEDGCDIGVIYFNNVGYIKMCVHGTIGVAVTLAHEGKLAVGDSVGIETCVGKVEAHLVGENQVRVSNVLSYRSAAGVEIEVEGYGKVRGDVAWGGNWFYLVEEHPLEVSMSNLKVLDDFSAKARTALAEAGITGVDGGEIDHVEVFAPAGAELDADSRNYVLLPRGRL